jgi:hypothetical protein
LYQPIQSANFVDHMTTNPPPTTDHRATRLTSLSLFNYRGLRLLPSRWQQQFQHTRDYYLAIPNDDILRDFRLRAG